MARNLIRLPQLNLASVPSGGSAVFGGEGGGPAILELRGNTGSEKIIAKQQIDMDQKAIDFLNGSAQSIANIAADGSIRLGQAGAANVKFELDASSGDIGSQGDLLIGNGDLTQVANEKFKVTSSNGDVFAAGLANLNGGIEVDVGGNKFTVSTAGAVFAAGLANLDGGIEVYDGSKNVFTVDTSGNTYIAGNLEVDGTRTFLNTQESSLEDTTIALGIPQGMMDITYTVTDGGGSPDTITITFDAADQRKQGGANFANNDKVYVVSSDLANGFQEDVYSLSNVTINGATSTATFTVPAGTYNASNNTPVAGFMSRDIFTQNNPYDGTGLVLPAQDRVVQFQWDTGKLGMELRSAHLRVLDNHIQLESSNGDAARLQFTQGNNSITLRSRAATANNREIFVPDASGTMAVSVEQSGGQAQGAENRGLQLSAAGELSIDINGCQNSLASGALDAADLFLVSDAGSGQEIKKTTLGDLQSFLAGQGTQKQFLTATASATGIVDYSGLPAGFITALEAAGEGSREVYLNGLLMREGGGHDYVVSAGNDELDFSFAIEADDQITICVRS